MPVLNQPALRSLPLPPLSLADRGPRHGLRRGPTYLAKEKGGSSLLLVPSTVLFLFSFFFFFYLVTEARLKENFWQAARRWNGMERWVKKVAGDVRKGWVAELEGRVLSGWRTTEQQHKY